MSGDIKTVTNRVSLYNYSIAKKGSIIIVNIQTSETGDSNILPYNVYKAPVILITIFNILRRLVVDWRKKRTNVCTGNYFHFHFNFLSFYSNAVQRLFPSITVCFDRCINNMRCPCSC